MSELVRIRRSFGSLLVHTEQSQPIMGIPWLVPVPRNVTAIVIPVSLSKPVIMATEKGCSRLTRALLFWWPIRDEREMAPRGSHRNDLVPRADTIQKMT